MGTTAKYQKEYYWKNREKMLKKYWENQIKRGKFPMKESTYVKHGLSYHIGLLRFNPVKFT